MKNLNPRVFRPLTPPSTKSLFPSTIKKQGPLNLRTISDFLTPLHHCGNSADMKLKTCPCVKAPSCWPAGFFSHLLRRVDVFWDMHMLILFYAKKHHRHRRQHVKLSMVFYFLSSHVAGKQRTFCCVTR